jgi:hypothetical protein
MALGKVCDSKPPGRLSGTDARANTILEVHYGVEITDI